MFAVLLHLGEDETPPRYRPFLSNGEQYHEVREATARGWSIEITHIMGVDQVGDALTLHGSII